MTLIPHRGRSVVAAAVEGLESRRFLTTVAAGLPDAAFAQQGVQFTDFYGEKQTDRLSEVLPMPDGRFVAVGKVTSPWSQDVVTYRPALARYHADGSLDRSYGENGSVGGEIAGLLSLDVIDVLMRTDGSIVILGRDFGIDGFSNRTVDRVGLVRYTPQGALDAGFGQGGFVELENLFNATALLEVGGKLLVAAQRKPAGAPEGVETDPAVVARLGADGSYDATFGAGGIAVLGGPEKQRPVGLVVHGDGRIVVHTSHPLTPPTAQGSRGSLIRLNGDGSPDGSFGGGGVLALPPGLDRVGTLTLAHDGGYLFASARVDVVEDVDLDTRAALEVAKLTADGALDPSFGAGGIASHLFDGVYATENDLLVQPDGRIIVAASNDLPRVGADTMPILARLSADGTVDATFASQGIFKAYPRVPLSAAAESIAFAAHGGILLGGTARVPPSLGVLGRMTSTFMLMRFHNPATATTAPVINIGAGTLTVRGTSGNDSIRLRTRADRRIEVMVNDLVESVAVGNVVTIHVTGGGGDDWIDARELALLKREGFERPGTIEGGDGNDIIAGSHGHDRIRGEFGNDRIDGGPGDDFISGNANHDRLHGGDGNDSILGAGGVDVLVGDGGDDTLFGGDNNDVLFGGRAADKLFGEAGNDKLLGEEGLDYLEGGAGHDTLDGGVGVDNLLGLAGNDLLLARDSTPDVVSGGEGVDRAEVDDLDIVSRISEFLP